MTSNSNSSRFASLDGARAVSIGLVVLSHMQGSLLLRLDPDYGSHYGRYLDFGNLGVRVFLVISGFLITSLLLRELARTGSISLRQFYLRRFFRIVPAYWTYLAAIAILAPLGLATADWRKLTEAFFYLGDYRWLGGALGHTWSLSVEEQFYLLWAPLIVLLGTRYVRIACLALLLIGPTFRLLSDAGFWPSSSKYAFETVCDALASGCALALLRNALWAMPAYRRAVKSEMPWILAFIALGLMTQFVPYWVRDLFGIPLLNVSIAMILDRYMRSPDLRVGRLLNAPLAVWFGTLSYSIYLWQQVFVWANIRGPWKILLILACASASYYLVERPFLRLRTRFRPEAAVPGRVAAAA
jgi:peptidoglycan/LPS O-acetylase OafA/YrhL